MGAEGVYMGTAFMATSECPIAEKYKQALIDADPYAPELRNKVFAPPPPGLAELTREQKVYDLVGDAEPHSESEPMPVMSGSMAVGMITEVVPVEEMIRRIILEAEKLLTGDSPLGRVLAAQAAE